MSFLYIKKTKTIYTKCYFKMTLYHLELTVFLISMVENRLTDSSRRGHSLVFSSCFLKVNPIRLFHLFVFVCLLFLMSNGEAPGLLDTFLSTYQHMPCVAAHLHHTVPTHITYLVAVIPM